MFLEKIAFAQQRFNVNSDSNVSDFGGLINTVIKFFLEGFIPFVLALALIVFLWGVAKYILSSGDEAQRKSGTQLMVYGLIGLFVMVSVWGLVGLLTTMFSIELGRSGVFVPQLPQK